MTTKTSNETRGRKRKHAPDLVQCVVRLSPETIQQLEKVLGKCSRQDAISETVKVGLLTMRKR